MVGSVNAMPASHIPMATAVIRAARWYRRINAAITAITIVEATIVIENKYVPAIIPTMNAVVSGRSGIWDMGERCSMGGVC